tara:strand:+ start:47 stop:295 length:249 start_codon:yes stop_codon:yes gene_type:complete
MFLSRALFYVRAKNLTNTTRSINKTEKKKKSDRDRNDEDEEERRLVLFFIRLLSSRRVRERGVFCKEDGETAVAAADFGGAR